MRPEASVRDHLGEVDWTGMPKTFTDQPEGESEDEPTQQEADALPFSGDHKSFKKSLVFNK